MQMMVLSEPSVYSVGQTLLESKRLSFLIYAFDSISNVLCLESMLLVHISICNPFKETCYSQRETVTEPENKMLSRDAVVSCPNNRVCL